MNENMTIREIKEHQKILEKNLTKELALFIESTGVKIKGLYVDTKDKISVNGFVEFNNGIY